MAKKRIFTVGFELPGDEFEYIPFGSDQSLLDADIILFEPSFGTHIARETYEGHGLFEQWASHPVSQELGHWRAELAAATNAGKLVIVFLAKPLTNYRYTGENNFSGTGRSRVTTNMVTLVGSYSAVPNVTSADAKSGREVRLTKDAAYLAAYWSEFGEFSAYEVFVEGKFSHTLITTKAGDKIVGAAVRGKGALLFLPPLRYDEKKFTKYDPCAVIVSPGAFPSCSRLNFRWSKCCDCFARRDLYPQLAVGPVDRPDERRACHRRLTDQSSPAWSRARNSSALAPQQRAAPSPVQRRVGQRPLHVSGTTSLPPGGPSVDFAEAFSVTCSGGPGNATTTPSPDNIASRHRRANSWSGDTRR